MSSQEERSTMALWRTPGLQTASNTRSSSGKGRKTGGKKGGGGKVTLEDALKMELKGGAFDGVSLGDLIEIDADRADADHGYGDGERDGRDYIAWLAYGSYENDYVKRRAVLVAEDAGIEPE